MDINKYPEPTNTRKHKKLHPPSDGKIRYSGSDCFFAEADHRASISSKRLQIYPQKHRKRKKSFRSSELEKKMVVITQKTAYSCFMLIQIHTEVPRNFRSSEPKLNKKVMIIPRRQQLSCFYQPASQPAFRS